LAALAGVADRSGWCPVDPLTFESLQQKNIHVIGDAAFAGSMPKSAHSGTIEGKVCATAIAQLFAGKDPSPSNLGSNCYSLVAPNYAISITGNFAPVNGEYTEVDNSIKSSPLDAPASRRADDAKDADAWFRTITSEIFG
jgi:sulfide dehydrogenase [flavocytochrome c] flavoprotein subunit